MSKADALGRHIKCPFYISTDGQTNMCCEGANDGNRCGLTFSDKAAYSKWRRQICSRDYRQCVIYHGLLHLKYRDV